MLYIIVLIICIALVAAFYFWLSWALCKPYRRKIKLKAGK